MPKKQPLISVIIPTYNSHKYISAVFDAILNNNYKNLEIIVVDDNSIDHTLEIVETYKHKFKNLSIIIKPKNLKKSAAISTNIGVKKAKADIVCSIDSDAIISNNWFNEVLMQFQKNKKLGAVAGYIYTGNKEIIWASFMGAELEDRYDQIFQENNVTGAEVDHISTCNTAYSKKALNDVKLLDEELYYGYDVDLSYKLKNKGYALKLMKNISCEHFWKESLIGYLKQQYNVAYGRMQILKRHPQRKSGDKVASWFMFMQVPLTGLWYGLLGLGILQLFFMQSSMLLLWSLLPLIILLVLQLPQTLRLVKKREDITFIFFPLFILLRNTAWCVAASKYVIRGITKI